MVERSATEESKAESFSCIVSILEKIEEEKLRNEVCISDSSCRISSSGETVEGAAVVEGGGDDLRGLDMKKQRR